MDSDMSGSIQKKEVVEYFTNYYEIASKLLGGLLSDFDVFFGDPGRAKLTHYSHCGSQLLRHRIVVDVNEIQGVADAMFSFADEPDAGLTREEFLKWANSYPKDVMTMSSIPDRLERIAEAETREIESTKASSIASKKPVIEITIDEKIMSDCIQLVQKKCGVNTVGLKVLITKFLLRLDPKTQQLSRESFDVVFSDAFGKSTNHVLTDVLFEFFDDDGSGSIDAVEFSSGLLALSSADPFRACVLFIAMDSDASGIIQKEEVGQYFKSYYTMGSKLLGGLLSDFDQLFGAEDQSPERLAYIKKCGAFFLRGGLEINMDEIQSTIDNIFSFAAEPDVGISNEEFQRWAESNSVALLRLSSFSDRFCIVKSTNLNDNKITSTSIGTDSPSNADGLSHGIHVAARKGDIGLLAILVREGTPVDTRDKTRKTALHWAAATGQDAVCQALLAMGALVNAIDNNGKTALHLAALKGDDAGHAVCCTLIESGADVTVETRDELLSSLHCAAMGGNKQVCKVLLDAGANPNACDAKEWTPLYFAVDIGCEDVLSTLVAAGASVDNATSIGWTVLHEAAGKGSVAACKQLIELGSKVNAADVDGQTPLHFAALRGSVECVAVLLNADADLHVTDVRGRNLLHFAASSGSIETCRLLLEVGVSVDERDANGACPLDFDEFGVLRQVMVL